MGLWSWHNSFLISNSSRTRPWTTQMFKWEVWRYWEISINLNSFVSIYFHILQKSVIFFPKFPLWWGWGTCLQDGAGSTIFCSCALMMQGSQGLTLALEGERRNRGHASVCTGQTTWAQEQVKPPDQMFLLSDVHTQLSFSFGECMDTVNGVNGLKSLHSYLPSRGITHTFWLDFPWGERGQQFSVGLDPPPDPGDLCRATHRGPSTGMWFPGRNRF